MTENIIEEMDSIISESLGGNKGADSKTISLEIMELAIRIEQLTKKHYSQISKKVSEPAARAMFRYLVSEENDHVLTLQKQYSALKDGKLELKDNIKPLSRTCPLVLPDKEIKQSDDVLPNKSEVSPNATDLEALKLAIEVKKRAIKFYCSAAEKLSESSAKKVFSHLIEVEQKHLKELQIQYMWLEQSGFWFDHTMVMD